MSVKVPMFLLEDIFRLLDYLNDLGDHDELHFHKTGYSLQFEYGNTLWELKQRIKRLQHQIEEMNLFYINEITEDEKHDLKEWVMDGNSVYDNPYSLYDESGRLMDFINGCRIGVEMIEEHSLFLWGELDVADNCEWNEDIPF